MPRPQMASGYLNMKVNSMKSTILAATILLSLGGPTPVLAEAPAVTVKPFTAKVVPTDAGSSMQQVAPETPAEAEVPVSELSEQQAAVLAGKAAEPEQVSTALAEAVTPANDIIEQRGAAGSPPQEVAAGASDPATATPGKPCPMQGMGMMRKGMGHGGHGPDGRKPGCDRHGGKQHDKHAQVVRRLDMIEARIAKIEAMLERLMQR